jgi:hypothetical protein
MWDFCSEIVGISQFLLADCHDHLVPQYAPFRFAAWKLRHDDSVTKLAEPGGQILVRKEGHIWLGWQWAFRMARGNGAI